MSFYENLIAKVGGHTKNTPVVVNRFKVEPLYEGSSVYYAVYKKRFLWGWKFISKFVYMRDAMRVAKELSQPPTYIE